MRAGKALKLAAVLGLSACILLGAAGAQTILSSQSAQDVSPNKTGVNDLELASNRYAQYHTPEKAVSPFSTNGYTMVAKTKNFALWLDKDDSSIRLVDLRNGYVWGGANGDVGLNNTWTSYADSIVSMTYFDVKFTQRRLGLSDLTVQKHYTRLSNGFSCRVTMRKAKISFTFTVTLSDAGLRFQLPGSSLQETGKYKLESVCFFPFLGSSYQDEFPGYVMIPDGPGALVPFQKSKSYLTGFDKKVYGDDYSIDSTTQSPSTESRPGDYINPEPTVTMPVLGIVHGIGQNALFTYVTSGAEYTSVTATPAGLNADYTWACMRFNYRQKYVQPVNKTDAGVIMPQTKANKFDADMTILPLHGADANYSGMARFYRSYLQSRKLLGASSGGQGSIPLEMEFLGADVKKQFLINGTSIFTTAGQAADILRQLKGAGIGNIVTVLHGYTKGGVNGGKLTTNVLDKRLGSSSDYGRIKTLSSELFLYNNPMTANKNQIELAGETGISISKAYIMLTRQNKQLLFPDTYYYSARLLPARIKAVLKNGWGISASGIALEGVGSTLYGDFMRGTVTSRLQTEQAVTTALSHGGSRTAFYGSNQYVLRYASELFNLPTTCSQYLFETDTVPFVQMVLAGSVPYYAPYVNTTGTSALSLLKMAEYDAYPAFIQTSADSGSLVDTPSEDLFSTCFNDWKGDILSEYRQLNELLSPVRGVGIADHTVLSEGHVRVTYANGKKLYLNYTETAWKVDSALTVKPISAQWGV